MKTLQERFTYLAEKKNVTNYEISKTTGISDASLSRIKNGKTSKLNTETAEILANYFQVEKDWLNNGVESNKENFQVSESKESNAIKNTVQKLAVPYYNVDFAGGWRSDELFTSVKPSFFISNPEFERAEFACNLYGQSISNRIPHRSIIGLREIHDWQTYFPTNEIYAIIMKNDLRTVKIVKRSKEKENHLELIPDARAEYNNTSYDTEIVPIDFVAKMFQVIAHASFERIAM